MSGTAESVRPPKNDAEWARDTSRRLDSVENPTSMRVGEWVLSTSTDGSLIASNVNGGSVVIARQPAGGENDPDTIQDDAVPAVSVVRNASQTLPSGGAAVIFDGARFQSGGDWTGGKTTFDAINAPVSGIYQVSGSVHFRDGSGYWMVIVLVDDQPLLYGRISDNSGQNNIWLTSQVNGLLRVNAGQKIQLWAAAYSGQGIGSTTLTTSPVPTVFSMSLVQRS
jgi:hypothetical protein